MTETEMVLDCYNKLVRKNAFKEVLLEVPYLSRCIDMVLVDQDDKIVSVEFKLKNWKSAIKQANDHRLGADKAYICLPKPQREISETLKFELQEFGIGLFLYDENNDYPLEEVITPRTLDNRWKPWIDSLKDRINRVSEKSVFEI